MTESRTFRPIATEEEARQWSSFVHYAFSLEESFEKWWEHHSKHHDAMEQRWGFFADDQLVSSSSYIPFVTRIRGQEMGMAGISNVATPPEHRRRGYAQEMLGELLDVLRERDLYLTCLWPFSREFYGRYGWANGAEYSTVTLSVHDLQRLTRRWTVSGRMLRASLEDIPALSAAHGQWLGDYDLATRRYPEWWEHRIFWFWKEAPYIYKCVNEQGEVSGYLAYTVKDQGDWKRTLNVVDVGYRDLDTYRSFLVFLHNHDSQVSEYRLSVPMQDPLFDWLPAGKVRRQAGVMIRVLDVASAVEILDYPSELVGQFQLRIDDPFYTAGGDFRITLENGTARVERHENDPDLTMGIGAFSQLFVGYRRLDDLLRFGQVTEGSDALEARALLRRMYPARRVTMMDHF